MIHYFYGTLQVGIGQTLCSFEHVLCSLHFLALYFILYFYYVLLLSGVFNECMYVYQLSITVNMSSYIKIT